MLIPFLGKFAVAQALTSGTTDSENVMAVHVDGDGKDYSNITDVWLTIDTNVAAGGSGALTFDLVLAKEAALNNVISVVQIKIAAVTDKRVAEAGRHITAINIGKVLKDMLDTDGSDYEFIGLIVTLTSSATISYDASLGGAEPATEYHRMKTKSEVGVPALASP